MKRVPARLATLLLASGLALPLAPSALAADPANTTAAGSATQDFASRLATIASLREALLRDSAAAGVSADDVLARVQASTDEARALAAAGEADIARSLLDDAYKLLAGTIARTKRGTVPVHEPGSADPQAAQVKAQADFARELASARALLDAYQRLAGDGADRAAVARFGTALDGAAQTAGQGDLATARARLQETYGQIKVGITALERPASAAAATADGVRPSTAELQLRAERKITESRALLDALKRLAKTPATQQLAAAIERQLGEADRRRSGEPQAALALAEDAYGQVKIGLQSLQQSPKAAAKGKAAAGAAPSGADTARGTEFANRVESVRLLRSTLVRLSKERKVDNGAALARADRLTGEARRLARDSLPLALATIDEAYAVVKQAVIATQAR